MRIDKHGGFGSVVTAQTRAPFNNSTLTQPQGHAATVIVEGTVEEVSRSASLASVRTTYDGHFYGECRWGDSSKHSGKGGSFHSPRVGSKCLLCLPSDGSSPTILTYVNAMEVEDDEEDQEPDISFKGFGPIPKPGDWGYRGIDGSFFVLHDGGMVQIGAGPLAQRLYLPLTNIIHDICQNYRLSTVGTTFSVAAAMNESESNGSISTTFCIRYDAGDERGFMRLKMGRFTDPVPEPAGEAGAGGGRARYEMKAPVLELVVSAGAFDDDGRAGAKAASTTTFRFALDDSGNVSARVQNMFFRAKGAFEIDADGAVVIKSKVGITMTSPGAARIGGSALTEVVGDIVKLGAGADVVAHVGSVVEVSVGAPILITVGVPGFGELPGTIVAGQTLLGQVTTGKIGVRV